MSIFIDFNIILVTIGRNYKDNHQCIESARCYREIKPLKRRKLNLFQLFSTFVEVRRHLHFDYGTSPNKQIGVSACQRRFRP